MKDHELRKKVYRLECEIIELRKQSWANIQPIGCMGYSTGEHYTGEEIHKRFEELYKFLGVERKTLSGTTLEKVKPKQ